jgi:hypothetical protein
MTKKKRLLLLAAIPFTIAVTLGVLAMLPPEARSGSHEMLPHETFYAKIRRWLHLQ